MLPGVERVGERPAGILDEVEVIGTLYVLTKTGTPLLYTARIPDVDHSDDFSPPFMYW